MSSQCGRHSILRGGFLWALEAPDVMQIRHPHSGVVLLHWNEADGFVRYNDDDTQVDFPEGSVVCGHALPTNAEAEQLIEELRAADGVEY